MHLPSPSVAVLDDEPEMRKALRRLLLACGFRVQVYAGAEDLLASLAAGLPDCIVLDLQMAANGFGVLKRLASQGAQVPVVVISGQDEPSTEERVRKVGVEAYLLKPVDETALLSAIETAISRASSPID